MAQGRNDGLGGYWQDPLPVSQGAANIKQVYNFTKCPTFLLLAAGSQLRTITERSLLNPLIWS